MKANGKSIICFVFSTALLSSFLFSVLVTAQENYDFRQVNWGMTPYEVRKSEKEQPYAEDENTIIYSTKVFDYEMALVYVFVNNKLVRASYKLTDTFSNQNKYIIAYRNFLDALCDKYGVPNSYDPIWTNNTYKEDSNNWGQAIAMGQLTLQSIWSTPDTGILLQTSGNNFDIEFVIEYTSNEYGHLETEQREIETMNQL